MKNHQFERVESLLQDILEELKASRLSIEHPLRYDLINRRARVTAGDPNNTEPTAKFFGFSDFSKNITPFISPESSLPESDSKAG